jgi:hypothetical protein
VLSAQQRHLQGCQSKCIVSNNGIRRLVTPRVYDSIFEMQIMAIACLFLACKVEECPRSMELFIKVAWDCRVSQSATASEDVRSKWFHRITQPVGFPSIGAVAQH